MPSNEERRQAAREKLERQNERRAADVRKRKIVGISIGAVTVVALVAAGCWLWLPQGPTAPLRFGAEKHFNQTHVSCDFADRGDQVAAARKSLDANKAQVSAAKDKLKDLPADQQAAMKDKIKAAEEQNAALAKSIPKIEAIAARNDAVAKPSGVDVPTSGTYDGTITTSLGEIGFELDRAQAPCNVETFLTLINAQYFNDTICHRETAQPGPKGADGKEQGGLFVLQCGDPSGTGMAGPNWTSPDEAPTDLADTGAPPTQMGQPATVIYPAGTIAVAKSSSPNSGSSQFFLVYQDTWLPADYAVIGHTTDAGLKTLLEIAKKGIAVADFTETEPGQPITNGKPKEPVRIEAMSLA